MTYLISLLSEHLLPNYLLAKEFEGKYDQHIFITTRRMDENSMTSRFCNALGIDKQNVKVIMVSEDDFPDTQQKLGNEIFNPSDKYLINLTGGTKIMSIAVFQHFFKFDSQFFYVPIATNKIENVRSGESSLLKYRVNVPEYLSLYGLRIEVSNTGIKDNESKGERFEKFVLNRIKTGKKLSLVNMQIAQGVKIYRDHDEKLNDNEIDVMWIDENKLFVGECKVSLWKPKEIDNNKRPINNPPEYLDEIMYKLSAISKDFGLQVNPYIFIKNGLEPKIFNKDRLKSIEKRMKILGIKGILNEIELSSVNRINDL